MHDTRFSVRLFHRMNNCNARATALDRLKYCYIHNCVRVTKRTSCTAISNLKKNSVLSLFHLEIVRTVGRKIPDSTRALFK